MTTTIYTHFNVDLDAVASVWAVRRFTPGFENANIVFKPANWDGVGASSHDLIVDISCGMKGYELLDGRVGSCFTMIVDQNCEPEEQQALLNLTSYIDAQDSTGNAVKSLFQKHVKIEACEFIGGGMVPKAPPEFVGVLSSCGLNAVLRSFQAMNPRNDLIVCEKMGEIFDGMLKAGLARQRAEVEASSAKIIADRVAICDNNREFATNGCLFEKGIQAIVYIDGNNIGCIRKDTCDARMDHPDLRAVVEEAGELDEWFAHPAGFLFCRGSRKAPSETPSRVIPEKLAETLSNLV